MERKNHVLAELARTMLNDYGLPKYFWRDAISMACYVLNRILIHPILDKTPYELLKGRKPNLSHLHVFGCKYFVLNNGKDNLGKFDAKVDEGIFLRYSQSSKVYRVYNKRLHIVEESVHVTFNETFPNSVGKDSSFHGLCESIEDILKDIDEGVDQPKSIDIEKDEYDNQEKKDDESHEENDGLPLEWRTSKDHPIENIIGDIIKGVTTCSKISNFVIIMLTYHKLNLKTLSIPYLMSIGLWPCKVI